MSPAMILTIVFLLGAAIAIYLACEYFVNAIEWVGQHLNLGATAVGSVLAAFGTALPECAVTLFAVVFGKTEAEKSIGIGAAMGGPLVLSTLSYAVVGIGMTMMLGRAKTGQFQIPVNIKRLGQDQLSFLLIFMVKLGLGLVVFACKPWLAFGFLVAYGVYIWREVSHPEDASESDDLEGYCLCHPYFCRPTEWSGSKASFGALLDCVMAIAHGNRIAGNAECDYLGTSG